MSDQQRFYVKNDGSLYYVMDRTREAPYRDLALCEIEDDARQIVDALNKVENNG